MTGDVNAILVNRLRVAANEMLQLAEELAVKPRPDASRVADQRRASMPTLVALAAEWHANRERRGQFFESDILGEPAWDILLYLFARLGEGHQVRKTELCNASGVPHTTALRYIALLQHRGLIAQTRCSTDARVQFVSMSREGMARMAACLRRSLRERSSPARAARQWAIATEGEDDIPTASCNSRFNAKGL